MVLLELTFGLERRRGEMRGKERHAARDFSYRSYWQRIGEISWKQVLGVVKREKVLGSHCKKLLGEMGGGGSNHG